jgi:hypothetical protein
MAKKPTEPPKPIVWNVYKFASRRRLDQFAAVQVPPTVVQNI